MAEGSGFCITAPSPPSQGKTRPGLSLHQLLLLVTPPLVAPQLVTLCRVVRGAQAAPHVSLRGLLAIPGLIPDNFTDPQTFSQALKCQLLLKYFFHPLAPLSQEPT